ncbi:MAG: hypothetical protein DMG42_35475 [Acidobacteria bacterium]|nr:MAG: hypothetical protein DMG42_35475 [Acidobacteriota bacterium]
MIMLGSIHRVLARICAVFQSRRKLDLWQGCHEIAEKSSKIVPLGAPFSSSLFSTTSVDTL